MPEENVFSPLCVHVCVCVYLFIYINKVYYDEFLGHINHKRDFSRSILSPESQAALYMTSGVMSASWPLCDSAVPVSDSWP